MRLLTFLTAAFAALAACSGSSTSEDRLPTTPPRLARGPWHGTLTISGGRRLPVELLVLPDSAGRPRARLLNGGESFLLTDFQTVGADSLRINLHVFEAALVGKAGRRSFKGYWQKFDSPTPYRVPFVLRPGRAAKPLAEQAIDFSGRWAVRFRDAADSSEYPAVGEFKQRGNTVTGTFLTETGDYRYLRGTARKDSLRLYTFDGAHGYVFEAQRQADGSLRGDFWAGLNGHETWTAATPPPASPTPTRSPE